MIGILRSKLQPLQGLEVGIFIVIIVGVGYIIDRSDPLLIHYKFNLVTLWLTIVTLYYGLRMGLLMWSVFLMILLYINQTDSTLLAYMFENLFFVALFGLFFHNYKKRVTYLSVSNKHLRHQLKELGNSFFTLKVSHDKLESTYISQPSSLRYVLSDLLDRIDYSSVQASGDTLLNVLEKFFMVKSSMLWEVKNSQLSSLLAAHGNIETNIDLKDSLIAEALEQKQAMYLKNLTDKEQTNYIFVVPFLDDSEEVITLLIIQEIPFLFYKEDSLLKINVMFQYLWTELEKRLIIENRREEKEQHSTKEGQDIIDFKSKVIHLQKIEKEFNIESRLYAIWTDSAYLHESISEYFYKNKCLTPLDHYLPIKCKNHYLHFVILSFASSSKLYSFKKDFNMVVEKIEQELEPHLSQENYKKIATKSISIKYFDKLWEEYGCVDR